MNISILENLLLFILFVIPGFITLKTYHLLVPSENAAAPIQIIDAITYSSANYALLSWAIYLIESNAVQESNPIAYVAFYFCVLFVAPILIALLWRKIRHSHWVVSKTSHPSDTAWNFVFQKRKPYWVVVTLADGSKIFGEYGYDSFASSVPSKQQIFLERVWHGNNTGGFEKPKDQTAGVIVTSSDIAAVELFEYEDNGE